MDDMIKQTISARKNAIYDTYDVDRKTKEKIEDLFKRIEELGKKCNDVGEFELEFSKSGLTNEYTEIFTYVATNFKPVGYEEPKNHELEDKAQVMMNTVDDEIKRGIKDATLPARRKIREEVEKDLRNTPIIGDVLNVKQHLDFFNKQKKNKN